MSYTTPVTDRTALDIANRTTKGHWNVADWERVYNNSQLVNSLVAIMLAEAIQFDTLTVPTITTIPSATDFNIFLANIERTRTVFIDSETDTHPGTQTEIKDDYIAGPQGTSPKYTDANLWESTLDAIWNYYDGALIPVCPTLTNNETPSSSYVAIDCLDMADFNMDLGNLINLIII
jgi:hypothetical protein